MNHPSKVLLIGYGNPGRLDDGLGQRLADRIAAEEPDGVTVITEYQLQLEHAHDLAQHDVVVFADASVSAADPFDFCQLQPSQEAAFSTHSVCPEALLALADEHFGHVPRSYALAIRGHEFNEYEERLSTRACSNLEAAADFLRGLLATGDFEAHVTLTGKPAAGRAPAVE